MQNKDNTASHFRALYNRIMRYLTPSKAKKSFYILIFLYIVLHLSKTEFDNYYIYIAYNIFLIAFLFYMIVLLSSILQNKDCRESKRILFLRRFHKEVYPAFPLSIIVSKLGQFGFEPVTLADSVIDGDDRANTGLAMTLAILVHAIAGVLFALIFLYAVWRLAGMVYLMGSDYKLTHYLRDIPINSGFMFVVTFNIVVLFIVGYYSADLTKGGGRIKSTYLFNIFIRVLPRRLIDLRSVTNKDIHGIVRSGFRHVTYGGMAVIWSSDEMWEDIILEILGNVHVIIVDISNPSKNIYLEVAMLSRAGPWIRIVWAISDDVHLFDVMNIEISGYTVFGVEFFGTPHLFRYPSRIDFRYPEGGGVNSSDCLEKYVRDIHVLL